MTGALLLQVLIVALAMLGAGAFGYAYGRMRMRQDTEMQLSMMAAEISKMRRRASTAKAGEDAAQARLSTERRRIRRRA